MTEPGGTMRDGLMMDGGVLLIFILLTVIGVAGLILGVVLMVKERSRQGHGKGRHAAESPREILDRRYATGELSREQYRQAREELER
jgi:putative membrane protein